jgi:magnesium-transporting ATPase (P-type)
MTTPHQQSAETVIAGLGSDARLGLGESEARARLERHGRNELAEARAVPGWRRLLAHFANVLSALLLFAAAVSFALWLIERDSALPYEAIAIFAIVVLNVVMGHIQESRAESAVNALRRMAAAQARVVRDGELRMLPAAGIVPGDIIVIEEGDTIAADARLIHAVALQTAEAALTGESEPVSKSVAAVSADAGLADRVTWSSAAQPPRTGAAGRLSQRPECRRKWDASPECSIRRRAKRRRCKRNSIVWESGSELSSSSSLP